MLTRWLHTCSPGPVLREGRNKQLGTRVRTGAPRMSAALLHPSGTAHGVAIIHFKAKMECHTKVCGVKFTSWSTPKWKMHYKSQCMQETVLAGTRLVLWDRWQVWWLWGLPAGYAWWKFPLSLLNLVAAAVTSTGTWAWAGQARGTWMLAGLQQPFPQPPAPGKAAALGRAVLSHPHLSCSGLLHGAKSPVVLCIKHVHSEMWVFPLAPQQHKELHAFPPPDRNQ